MVAMKVQLIVVQGKSEGKTIPLTGPVFRIGRGETCHLRPNSERVSREHAEIVVTADSVAIRDLGSRNGTLVNGKALTHPLTLRDRDLVQVGPLIFAISLLEAGVLGEDSASLPAAGVRGAASSGPAGTPSETGLKAGDADIAGSRGCETVLIPAFFDVTVRSEGSITVGDEPGDDEYERHPVVEGDTVLDLPATASASASPPGAGAELPAGKKTKTDPGGKRSSSTAAEILRKMMERRPISK